MIVNEMFVSLQGEGKYTGFPTIFIRLSGCNKACSFCDTKYHTNGIVMGEDKIIKFIKSKKIYLVTWTGGEPTLQIEGMKSVMKKLGKDYKHNIETNGTFLDNEVLKVFNYVCFSPKNKKDLNNLLKNINPKLFDYDIKIVTDLKSIGVDMIKRGTMLMPLTTYNKLNDKQIKLAVWDYCVKNKKKYTPRLQNDLFGKKRGV